jgi:hypothetical protein
MKVLILSIIAIILYTVPILFVPVVARTFLAIDVVAQSLSLYIAYTLLTKKPYDAATAYVLALLALGIVAAHLVGLPENSSEWFLLDGGCMSIWSLVALREILK